MLLARHAARLYRWLDDAKAQRFEVLSNTRRGFHCFPFSEATPGRRGRGADADLVPPWEYRYSKRESMVVRNFSKLHLYKYVFAC